MKKTTVFNVKAFMIYVTLYIKRASSILIEDIELSKQV